MHEKNEQIDYALFYVNSCILYNFLPNNEEQCRHDYLKNLLLDLIKPHLRDRLQKPGLHTIIRLTIKEILGENCNVLLMGSDKKKALCFML